jgi:hypothetical protein
VKKKSAPELKLIPSGTARYPDNERSEMFHVKQSGKQGGTAINHRPAEMMVFYILEEEHD